MTLPPILLVGEAYGDYESHYGAPFVGPTGAELLKQLHKAEIITLSSQDWGLLDLWFRFNHSKYLDKIWSHHEASIRRTNVFNLHPPGNRLSHFCGPKTQALGGYPPLVGAGKFVRAEFENELERLCGEILSSNPNIVVCLGGTALWALAGRTQISKWRGATLYSSHTVADYKLLPTFHPSAIVHQYSLRPTAITDLAKAHRESLYPDLRRPSREIWIEPTLDDVRRFIDGNIRRDGGQVLSVDIETVAQRITCIGFAPSAQLALVIPFDDPSRPGGSYWESREDERTVWRLVAETLGDGRIPKLFHNGLYDIAFLWRSMRIPVRGATHDTMLLMHSLQPEARKSLAYCGSIYSNECAWKNLGAHHKTIKREDT